MYKAGDKSKWTDEMRWNDEMNKYKEELQEMPDIDDDRKFNKLIEKLIKINTLVALTNQSSGKLRNKTFDMLKQELDREYNIGNRLLILDRMIYLANGISAVYK